MKQMRRTWPLHFRRRESFAVRTVLSVRQNEALLLAAEPDDGHTRTAVAARSTLVRGVAAAATAAATCAGHPRFARLRYVAALLAACTAAAIAAFGRLRVSGAAAATTAPVLDVLTGDGHNHAIAAVTAVELYAS